MHDKNGQLPNTPIQSNLLLQQYEHEESHDNKRFHYRSVIGKLNYLEKSTRPDISYAVNQCARFTHDPKKSHTEAIIHLVNFLKKNKILWINVETKSREIIGVLC